MVKDGDNNTGGQGKQGPTSNVHCNLQNDYALRWQCLESIVNYIYSRIHNYIIEPTWERLLKPGHHRRAEGRGLKGSAK